ncbi:MAG: DUF1559 domain-containing protein [Gemmataceae bacterium]|nr:DUF1559 domain-containing protein [Gemmataceae bacterium]
MTLLELLVVIALFGVLAGLLLAAVQRAREVAARAECQNHVRQLGLALHLYHDARNSFPPGHRRVAVFRNEQFALSGWTLSVLPYLEQQALHDKVVAAYRIDWLPFNDPPHTAFSTVVPVLTCPSDPRVHIPQVSHRTQKLAAFTSYLGVAGSDAVSSRDGLLFQSSTTRLADATDGTSTTLLLGERPPGYDFQFGWWYAGTGQLLTGSADLVLGVREPNLQAITASSRCGPGKYPFMPASGFDDPCGMFHFWSPHPGGANFLFADGSVRFLKYTADPVLPALSTRAGGEPATDLD